jgi:hypothetical protein
VPSLHFFAGNDRLTGTDLAWCVLDRFGRSSLRRANFPISSEKDTRAVPQLRHPAYIPGIDGLRAVAVLSVML